MARRQLTDENLSPGDYVSEGLSIVRPDAFFPNLVIGDKANHPQAYLPGDNGHNWYCDRRSPSAGSLTRDEAILLYNLALQFRNRTGLEVGGGMGWSTCHLGLAGLILDVLDPAFADAEHTASVKDSLAAAGIVNHVRLYSTASPDGVRDLARMTGNKWNFFFIDGDSRAPAPLLDTRECLESAAPDAMIVFHDLASPDVEEGLNFLWQQGWQVLLYQTMHIMGAAWRGNVKPVKHKSDPAITWTLPLHLVKYPVSGYTPDEEIQRLSHGIASRDREIKRLQQELSSVQTTSATGPDAARNDQVLRLQENLAAEQIRNETVISQLARLKMALFAAEADLMVFKNDLKLASQQAPRAEDHIAGNGAAKRSEEPSSLQAALTARETEIRCLVQNLANASGEVERLRTDLEVQRFCLGALHSSASWKVTAPLRALKKTARLIQTLPGRVAQRFRRPQHNVNAWRKHPLFDASFYLDANPDVAQAGIDPLLHYIERGAGEGRDPHPLFDTSFYLEKNPDVAEAGLNPLFHYMDHGGFEGRDPHPLFDTSFYCDNNPEVLQERTNPLFHFLSRGGFEAGDPHPLFSVSFYFHGNPDIRPAGINPLVHFVVHGAHEERDPHPLFDTSFYLEQKPHVRGLKTNPLVHFLGEGSTPEFDVSPTEPMPDVGICIVTPDIVGPVKNGGIGTSCYHYLRILQRAGHAVSVFYTGDLTDCQKAHWRNVYQKFGVKFIALSDAPPITHPVYASNWFLERSWRTYEYLRHTRYSVIHFQDWHANGFWSIKAKQVGCAFEETLLTVITQASTRWINEGMQQFGANAIETAKLVWAETYCMERCDLLISPSQHMIQWAKNNKITLPRRTMLAPYVWADPTETSRSGHVDNDHIVFFGRLETRKGLHIFGQALLELRQKSGNLPKVVSFIGKHANVLGRLSSEFIEDLRVALPSVEIRVINHFDYRQSLEYIKATRGLVVLPSILDNYPLTVLECIQSGLPFIAARTGGIPEMIDERVCFEPNAAALAECLQNRQLIDFGNLQHKYSAGTAAKTWLDLHADVGSPNFQAEARPPVQSEVRPQMVSICIPFFNHPTYLESLIASVAFQTYPAFEVILVNDGSNAEASAKFDHVARRCRDSRFHFFTTENAGPGAARNFAASRASGDLLLFFDADNMPKSDSFIHALVSALEHSGADCLTCPFDIVADDKVRVTEEDVIATYRPFGPCVEAGFFENVLGDATMIMSRAVFKALGGFPTGRASWEDHEFLLGLCFKGFKLETFPEAIFYYRQSSQGRNKQANDYRNYQSLFSALQFAPPEDLARIIAAVGGPMLIGRPGTPSAKLASG